MCSLEFPDLDHSIAQQYDDDDLVVIGLALEYGFGETDALVRDFQEQTGVGFPIAWAPGQLFFQVDWPEALSPFPRQLVLNRDHEIVYLASEHRQSDLEDAVATAVAD